MSIKSPPPQQAEYMLKNKKSLITWLPDSSVTWAACKPCKILYKIKKVHKSTDRKCTYYNMKCAMIEFSPGVTARHTFIDDWFFFII